jgi:hypothetical protein
LRSGWKVQARAGGEMFGSRCWARRAWMRLTERRSDASHA